VSADDVANILARRHDPPPAANGGTRWEDRHVRWTVWIEKDLRDQIDAIRKARGISTRELVDELLRAGLEASTVDRPRPGRRPRP
jgi:plasmid stabilization system protein ParE